MSHAWDWMHTASVGDLFSYHIGVLATDRNSDPELDRTAKVFQKASDEGFVRLMQRRWGEDRHEYVAVRTDKLLRSFWPAQLNAVRERICNV